jgi:hypothetical protein
MYQMYIYSNLEDFRSNKHKSVSDLESIKDFDWDNVVNTIHSPFYVANSIIAVIIEHITLKAVMIFGLDIDKLISSINKNEVNKDKK